MARRLCTQHHSGGPRQFALCSLPSVFGHLGQQVLNFRPPAASATLCPQPILQVPGTKFAASWPQLGSCVPLAQPRQHVVKGRPAGVDSWFTGRPQPLRHIPGFTSSGSMLLHVMSWPKPSAQPRQQVVKGLPLPVAPGCTFRQHPFRQNPTGTPLTSGAPFSMIILSFSFHASSPSKAFSSSAIRFLSSSIQLNFQPCFAQMSCKRLVSLELTLCFSWATKRSTCLSKRTSPWI
mmetsp:Transcript_23960/g.80926  ORF Transcript_23960/g.80926 Transcript_23960/m.80926 type:complete len:235 (+) Transcript_23960:81-785(+)